MVVFHCYLLSLYFSQLINPITKAMPENHHIGPLKMESRKSRISQYILENLLILAEDLGFIWVFLYKWWYPQNTPKWSFLVGKPMVLLGKPTISGVAPISFNFNWRDFRIPWRWDQPIVARNHHESMGIKGSMTQIPVLWLFNKDIRILREEWTSVHP